MSRRRAAGKPPPQKGLSGRSAAMGLAAVALLALVAAAVFVFVSRSPAIQPLSRLHTADVHSLAFVGDDSRHLVFGHHGGVLETLDGGRTWANLAARQDAMGMSSATGGSIVIAGHGVFSASPDGGRTWASIATDLPGLDIHGFTRDPVDPGHMWAALATGGLWESRDGGLHFAQVYGDNVLMPVAMRGPSGPRLVAVAAAGLVQSDDNGRTWVSLGDPGLYPMISLAATIDGTVLIAGGPDGLRRSDDGGRTWRNPGFPRDPFAVAISNDGRTVAAVTRAAEFFRSDDGGKTWASP